MRLIKRLCSLLFALAITFGVFGTTAAYATNVDGSVSYVTSPNDSAGVSPASLQTTFGPGEWYWGGVTFTGENGGAYKTINGSQIKLKIFFKAVDNDSTSYHLYLSFKEYGGRLVYYGDLNSWSVDPEPDGFLYYETGWLNVHSGVDYRFLYDTNSECLCDDDRRVEVHIWVDIR